LPTGDIVDDLVLIGIVRRVRGNKGDLKVESLSDAPARFTGMKSVIVKKKNLDTNDEYAVEKSEELNDYVVMKFRGVDTYEQAEEFLGAELMVPESERAELPADMYYVDSLVGMTVCDTAGKSIGKIIGVEKGIQSLLVIRELNGHEFSLPFVREFVKEVNTVQSSMKIDLIDGMIEGGIDED